MFLNVFALHYFLWFSALTPIFGYIGFYAKHYANVDEKYYGILNFMLTFISIPLKPIVCSYADRKKAHRKLFIIFLFTSLLGYGSFGILPFFLKKIDKADGLYLGRWLLICVMTSVATLSMSVISCFSDAFAVSYATKKQMSYGWIRFMGSIGWALMSLLISIINQYDTWGKLVPGLLVTIVLISIDVVVNILWPFKQDYILDTSASGCTTDQLVSQVKSQIQVENAEGDKSIGVEIGGCSSKNKQTDNYGAVISISNTNTNLNQDIKLEKVDIKTQIQLLLYIARHRKSFVRYLIGFIFSGLLISLQWNYLFTYMEQLYKGSDFDYFSGISMLGQSLLGEVPFFLLAKSLIKYLGHSGALSVSIASIGVRYLIYAYVLPHSSGYLVLLSEAFQGPSFGLLYVVLTSVGLSFSDCDDAILHVISKRGSNQPNEDEIERLRHCLRSLMIAVVSAAYEGLGAGLGALIGGFAIGALEYQTVWLVASLSAISYAIVNISLDYIKT